MSAIEDQIRDASNRNSQLLATLARTDYASPSLRQQIATIGELEAEERRNNDKIKKLTLSREKEAKDHHKYSDSVMKRFTVSISEYFVSVRQRKGNIRVHVLQYCRETEVLVDSRYAKCRASRQCFFDA